MIQNASSAHGGGGAESLQNPQPLPLSSVNHLSRNCRDIQESLKFYVDVLGFVPVKRPNALEVRGAWLYNYGIGIHLLQQENAGPPQEHSINPRDDHISFQCEDLALVQKRLGDAGIKYEKRIVQERGIEVEQIFFHDPDGFMIEICTCERLPVEPLSSSTGKTREDF
ncbi:hypothetical protein SELMODRAFT_94230 [Selaginella moellendorffii]|uniref:VOC domain-containing protein n=1 Tax=Selaginella moellendorffii TaxID=88036 RepID=D8RIL5_SELML|nr:uncharacterized protein LOC9633209 [Selaginella moellendorffii]XP_002991167.1 uncharacterized protein LOC9635076 [Selaginella moellendorffii]EFJ07813.1 hypothetical protein SELMODRAFT_133006 [Selaginella moellendorffii]EFJ28271.1 hypothetical protein SELMODRAFT_94230 [Selaginella moellendorffii]|eukprot:XP_002970945.1 uncharacterized protein LOC9633209 [Selaginella moellendorffii]